MITPNVREGGKDKHTYGCSSMDQGRRAAVPFWTVSGLSGNTRAFVSRKSWKDDKDREGRMVRLVLHPRRLGSACERGRVEERIGLNEALPRSDNDAAA